MTKNSISIPFAWVVPEENAKSSTPGQTWQHPCWSEIARIQLYIIERATNKSTRMLVQDLKLEESHGIQFGRRNCLQLGGVVTAHGGLFRGRVAWKQIPRLDRSASSFMFQPSFGPKKQDHVASFHLHPRTETFGLLTRILGWLSVRGIVTVISTNILYVCWKCGPPENNMVIHFWSTGPNRRFLSGITFGWGDIVVVENDSLKYSLCEFLLGFGARRMSLNGLVLGSKMLDRGTAIRIEIESTNYLTRRIWIAIQVPIKSFPILSYSPATRTRSAFKLIKFWKLRWIYLPIMKIGLSYSVVAHDARKKYKIDDFLLSLVTPKTLLFAYELVIFFYLEPLVRFLAKN